MKKLIITIESHYQLKTILDVLRVAEEEGEIDFPFNALAVDIDEESESYFVSEVTTDNET